MDLRSSEKDLSAVRTSIAVCSGQLSRKYNRDCGKKAEPTADSSRKGAHCWRAAPDSRHSLLISQMSRRKFPSSGRCFGRAPGGSSPVLKPRGSGGMFSPHPEINSAGAGLRAVSLRPQKRGAAKDAALRPHAVYRKKQICAGNAANIPHCGGCSERKRESL